MYNSKRELNLPDLVKSALFGVAVGDALGVPVEFKPRSYFKDSPVTDLIGYGTYNQPPGTWSDDSSLTFCLAESLQHGFNLQDIANNFVKWNQGGFWTAHGSVFDIGMATSAALHKVGRGVPAQQAGGTDEDSNGNGSLMRILPLLFYIYDKPISERFELTKQVSSITHAHPRSVAACFYYLEFARLLMQGKDKFEIYNELKSTISIFFESQEDLTPEITTYERILNDDIFSLEESDILSSGYVVHALEASMWCFLTTDNYKDAVLKAVNLGRDTDTTAAITGGLAGLLYGFDSIPSHWSENIAKSKDIEQLALRLANSIH